MPAKVLIIGDSHTIALHDGCDALGIGYHKVYGTGGAWFEGRYKFMQKRGLVSKPGPNRKKLLQLADEMGHSNIFDAGLPVIASFGFNFGKLLGALETWRHSIPDQKGCYDNDAEAVMSRGFAEEYVEALCGKNFRIIKNIARIADVTMVVPPRADASHNRVQLTDIITQRMTDVGAKVFDPGRVFTKSRKKALPAKYLSEDQIHGTSDYGQKIVEQLVELGALGSKLKLRKAA